MAKHSFYFDHDYNARNDQKILELRAEHGWHGYGVYFAIIEVLCESEGKIKRGALSGLSLGLNMAKADLVKLIDFMIEIGLLNEVDSIIFSNRVNQHLEFRTLLSEAGKRGGRGNKKPPFSPPLAPLEAGEERKGEEKKEDDIKIKKRSVFTIPTISEISDYCKQRKNNIDPNHFIDYYTTNGWIAGKVKMKDWKAAIRTWEKYDLNRAQNNGSPKKTYTPVEPPAI